MTTNTQIQTDLMKDLGLDNLPMEKQEELVIKMTEVVLKRMFVETMEKLNVRDQEAFGEMMEKKSDPKEIEDFLKEKISGYDEMLQKIVEDLREEMKKA